MKQNKRSVQLFIAEWHYAGSGTDWGVAWLWKLRDP